jgi:hypothetical protein
MLSTYAQTAVYTTVYTNFTFKGLGVLGDEKYPAGTGLPPQCDPVSWSNVSVQNRNYSRMQEQYGTFNQIIQGCAYTGGASRSKRDYTGGFG